MSVETAAAPLELKLNPALDAERFAETYRREGLVRIGDVLAPDVAATIADVLEKHVKWRLVFPEPGADGGRETVAALTPEEMQRMGRDRLNARIQAAMGRARRNYGYFYHAYPMIHAYLNGWDPGHPLHALTEFLNSPEFLDFGRRVIGAERITKAEAQATLYRPGNFLTRHVDPGHNDERRAAYTFGFTRDWQPDWGGLLLLLTENNDVERGFLPRFNVLTLFDGRRIHSVSQVASFAGAGRFQVTGWLRDDVGRNA